MVVHVNLLGTFEARVGINPPLSFATSKSKALFAYLTLNPNKAHSREKLAELLWCEANDKRARANLRQTLTRVRQAIPEKLAESLQSRNGSISLDNRDFTTDTANFFEAQQEGTIDSLEQAASLFRGDLLEGLVIDEPGFEDWLRDERETLRGQAVNCFDSLLDHYVAIGAITRGIEVGNRLLRIEPYRESVHRLLMYFYAEQDRRGAALAQFEECKDLLDTELGVTPEAETIELYEIIREHTFPTRFTIHPDLSRSSMETKPAHAKRRESTIGLVKRSPWQTDKSDKPSIAVLPFDCLGTEEFQVNLCLGIVGDVITNLTRYNEIHVLARNSSFSYLGRNIELEKIGRELGVNYLAQGCIELNQDIFRVSAQLIEVETGHQIWAEQFDKNRAELALIRDELTGLIANSLIDKIQLQQLRITKSRETNQWQAYSCYLQGMEFLRRINQSNLDAAIEQFEMALAIDPGYARAYAGLATAQYKAWCCLSWSSTWKLSDRALHFAQKAHELDENDYLIHGILGVISMYTRDFKAARFHTERAILINPHDAATLSNAAPIFLFLGETERAVNTAELAIRLNPFHPDWYLGSLGMCYYMAKDYERAVSTMEIAPDGWCETRSYLAAAHAQLGNIEMARQHINEFIRLSCEMLGGDPDTDMQKYLDFLINTQPYVNDSDLQFFVDGLELAGLTV